jgi:diguanylate cyclase (GGDEF)-like protein
MPREGLGELALAALGVSADGFAVCRVERAPDDRIESFIIDLVNESAARWLGRTVERCLGARMRELLPSVAELGLWDLMVATLVDGQVRKERLELPGASDTTLEFLMTRLLADDTEYVVVVGHDVTEIVAGERLLTAAYEMTAEVRATLQTALDSTSDAFAVYDVERDDQGQIRGLALVLINLAGAQLLSHGDPDELVGQELRDLYPAAEESGFWQAVGIAMERQVTTTFRLTEIVQPPPARVPAVQSDPVLLAWDNTIAPVGDERVVITWRDVSDEVRRERELEQAHDDAYYAATHDPLTGLANRTLLMEELTEALWVSADDERVGVVFVDLDGFKEINDHFGHAIGDELLQSAAARLLRIVRQGDTVARIGGDEFVLVLRRLPRDWDNRSFIERAQQAMEEPLLLAGRTIRPRASYGLAVSPPAPRDLDRLMKLADSEMYQLKQQRKQGCQQEADSGCA